MNESCIFLSQSVPLPFSYADDLTVSIFIDTESKYNLNECKQTPELVTGVVHHFGGLTGGRQCTRAW